MKCEFRMNLARLWSGKDILFPTVMLLFLYIVVIHPASLKAQEPTSTPQRERLSAEIWSDALQPSEACTFPCFMGINPGESTKSEMEAIVLANFPDSRFRYIETDTDQLKVKVSLGPLEGVPGATEFPAFPISILLYFNIADDLVQSIYIFTPIPEREFAEGFQFLAPVNLISNYGFPDIVRANLLIDGSEDDNTLEIVGLHKLLLVWNELGISVGYIKYSGNFPIRYERPFCFQITEVVEIDIGLQNLEGEETVRYFMEQEFQWDTGTRTLENISNLEIGDFISQFLENDGCFSQDMFDLGS